MLRIAAVALLALCACACRADAAQPETTRANLSGQPALLLHPAGPTTRVVLYVHGAGELADSLITRPEKAGIVARLLRDGFAVAATDAHGDNWGDPASVRDYVSLARWLRGRGLTDVYIVAQSMGGLDAMLLIDRLRPVAWAGIEPACNLAALKDQPLLAPGIRAAHPFGLPRPLSPVRPARVRGLPMMFWASPQDTRVPKATNTDECAAYARHRGADVRVVVTHGEHGNRSHFQPDRLARFLESG